MIRRCTVASSLLHITNTKVQSDLPYYYILHLCLLIICILRSYMYKGKFNSFEKEGNPPDDFFKGIKLSLKSILKHTDINTTKSLY